MVMKPSRRYPSSTDVARLGGVSQSAVSRAFSKGKSVSAETGRKVFEAARKLGYSPNFIPRILLKHRSQLVAVVISGTSNPFYAGARGVHQGAAKTDTRCFSSMSTAAIR
jgi:DNA-binding LacI/PurR family transcriptional regulator